MTARRLRAVEDVEPVPEPSPSLDYEWQERQRIARKDWSALHVRGDRSRPLDFVRRIVRSWRA